MSAPEGFVAMILTHGRPDRVLTYRILRQYGYTGPILLVVDDEDECGEEYRRRFPGEVVSFSKREAASLFDEGDNFEDRRAVVYARNAVWRIAREAGYRYFIQLDDDYNSAYFRFNSRQEYGAWRLQPLDEVFAAMIEMMKATPGLLSVCMAQGGDHIGGEAGSYAKRVTATRKAMNTFLCDVERPFSFPGKINEDTTAYLEHGRRGGLFLTITALQVNQGQTQRNDGGLTEIYRAVGTYVKSFYSVMRTPSCVKVTSMGTRHRRLHHQIDWNAAVPKIVRESHRKPQRDGRGSKGAVAAES